VSGSIFHILRSRTHIQRYRGRRVLFSCFALLDPFWAIPRAPPLVFIYYAPGLIFQRYQGRQVRFHVLRSRTIFRRYRQRRVPFLCFALSESFSAIPRASGPFLVFCAPGLVLGGTEGARSSFHVLRSRIYFGRYRGRRFQFSCIAILDSFSAVSRASGPVFIFALPDSYLAVPRAPNPVFMFCALGPVSGGTEGIGSRFHVLRPELIFGDNGGIGSRFHVLRS
jgi:hypothetical protein